MSGTREPAKTPGVPAKPEPPKNEVKPEGRALALTKKSIWKYFGAAFMEKKDGEYAVSLTRLLALICFGLLMYQWGVGVSVQETLLWTFWGLIGGKTAESMIAIWKGKKGT